MMKNEKKHGRVVAVVPAFVSQLTVQALFGIDERRYRLMVNKHRAALRITRAGRLVLVPFEDFEALISKMAEEGTEDTNTGDRSPVGGLESPDAVLAAVGHRRVSR